MGNKFVVETYGCKVNSYDTGLLQQRLIQAGFQNDKESQLHILNTCAVTEEATKEALRRVRRIKAKDPKATVVVTGCAAQVDTEKFTQEDGCDLVIANSHKGSLGQIVNQYLSGEVKEKIFKSNIFKKEDLEAGGGEELFHTRSFLKIQDGCNSFCTFCVIPFARGKSRSIPIGDLVEKVNQLHDSGVNEVVLTGVHIGDYEDESLLPNENRIEALLEQLLLKTKVPRFRLTSFEPIEINNRLLDLFNDSRMCPHFHMSIQSACTKVLSDMKRHYTAHEVEQSLNTIYNKIPNVFIGMDVIVGFPGETESEYLETYNRLAGLPWTKIHVFPYSERPGTFANRMEGKHLRHLIMERAKTLRELSQDRYKSEALKQVGSIKEVLLLNKFNTQGVQFGLSRDYWNIQINTNEPLINKEVAVKIIGYDYAEESQGDGVLLGDVIDS